MLLIYELIKDTWLFYVLIVVVVIMIFNIFARFFENINKLIDNILIIKRRFFVFIKGLFLIPFRIILLPFTIIKVISNYFSNRSLIVNNSVYKDRPDD